ncbi:MAG TPA: sodium:solute symporter family protein [Vicinamibacterales bacterium]|nr:sodium:solute symporter family protein [Vicinamibacterales bacterium]
MPLHLALLTFYSIAVVGLGIWSARYVRSSSAFFVAGRRLGPGLLFSSMLAANIGAGSTVGAAGLAYRDGLSAWWWVGSAGLGSIVFALAIAPRLWRLARDNDFYTTGDYLEFRYGPRVRAAAAVLVNLGALALLAGQLIAGATILNVLTGAPRWAGSLIGGAIMTVYFAAGGLLGTAWVNTLQLVVMLSGFAVALPVLLSEAGGVASIVGPSAPAWFGDMTYSAGPGSGWTLLALTGPAFVVSPGLIQKAYGANSERTVRLGIGANALALIAFAFVPVLLGMTARALMPGITDPNAVLPTLLTHQLPAWLGALALAAVFSTEVDTSDAILFMLSTSASKDVYKRFIRPDASDEQLLRVGRSAAVAGGMTGVVLSIWLQTVIGALTVFYSLLVVTLAVPIVGGLYTRRAGEREALMAIAAGVLTLFVLRVALSGYPAWLDPTLAGIVAGAVAFLGVMALRRSSR